MHNPFEALKKNPELRKRLKRAARPVLPEKKEPESLSEEDAFLAAVAGVTPLGPGGRAVTPPVSRKTPTAPPSFSSLLEEHIEFDMDYSREFLTGQVRGLDSRTIQKLRAGQFSIQGYLDMHGMNAEQARTALSGFLRRSYMEGKRSVLVGW